MDPDTAKNVATTEAQRHREITEEKCSRDGCTTMVVHASRVHIDEPRRTQRTQRLGWRACEVLPSVSADRQTISNRLSPVRSGVTPIASARSHPAPHRPARLRHAGSALHRRPPSLIEGWERTEARPARSRRQLSQETATKAGFRGGFLTQLYPAAGWRPGPRRAEEPSGKSSASPRLCASAFNTLLAISFQQFGCHCAFASFRLCVDQPRR